MAKDSGVGTILTLGAVAVGGYFLYENFFATTAAPVAAAPAPTVAPVTGNLPGTAAPITTVVPPPATTVEPPPVQPTQSVASILSSIQSGVATDPNFTGSGDQISSSPYRFNTYLNIALNGKTAPDLGTVFPGLDLTQPMTLATYWAAMGPAVRTAYGLSGFFAGLGAYRSMRGGMGDDTAIPVLEDTLTVTPATSGYSYTIDPTSGTVKATAPGMSTTTMLAIAAASLVGILLLTGRR